MDPDLESLLDEPVEPPRLVDSRPELVELAVVEGLCDRVVELLRSDLDRAERAAALAREVAERLDDEYARGRGERAAAVARVLRRDHREALRLLGSALERFEGAGDRLQAAITRVSAVEPLIHLGDYDRALAWAEAARAAFVDLGDRLRLARLELNLGAIQSRRDRHREALAHYRRGLAEARQVGTPQDVGIALRNIAVCLQDLNRFDDSLAAYREASEFCRAHGLPLFELELEANVAYLHYLIGEYGRAIELFEKSRRRFHELGDRHHAALCDLDQAEICLELNLLREAEKLARRAGEGFEELGMGYESAKALTVRGLARGRGWRADEALELLERARRLFVGEQNRVWPAQIDLHRAQVLLAAGRPQEARGPAEAAHQMFLDFGLPARQVAAELLLARLALASGEAGEALARCDAAGSRLRDLQSPALGFQVEALSARARELAGEPRRAFDSCLRAAEILEGLRRHLHTEEVRIAFAQDKRWLFESLVWLGLREARAPEAAEAAFLHMEMSKSRSLVDLLAHRAQALPPKRAKRGGGAGELRRLRQELNWSYRRLDRLEAGTDSEAAGDPAALRGRIRRLETELGDALRRVQAADREYGSLQAAATVDPETVRSALPADAALVEYFLARGRIFCCVLRRDSLAVEPLGEVEPVWQSFELLRAQLSKMRRAELRSLHLYAEKVIDSRLRMLHEALIAPISRHIDGSRHLVVVPHDFLHFLPFQALHDGETRVVERWTLSFAPSASVFHLASRSAAAGGGDALVLGIADRRAPAIADEARAVADALPGARLFLNERATLETLREAGRDARWIHLATHGHFREDNPMFSALQMGDGRLSLLDLYDLELRAQMVVLSGCGTGLSKVEGADDLVGLARGVLYAGARALLVTLWDVNDVSATDFMRAFYRHVTAGTAPARALAAAMRELRSVYPQPYHWAPFVLIGGAGLAAATPEVPFWPKNGAVS